MNPALVTDANGRKLLAGALVQVEGRSKPGRVNAVLEASVWVESDVYFRDPETGRCPAVVLEEVGADG